MSLPSGYKQLEYIESTGTQYIDTGVAPTNHEVRATFDSVAYNNDAALFGTSKGSPYFHFTEYSNKYYWGRNGSEANGGSWASGKRSLSFNSGSTYAVILDGVTLGSGTKITSSASLNIFCRAKDRFYSGRLYELSILDKSSASEVRDFIPVKRLSDGTIGLYDKVEQKFYANAGTGTFTAGPVKEPPAAPTNLHHLLAVRLAWSAVDGATGYNVYRDDVLLASTTETTFIDLTASENTEYTYSVSAVNSAGESSKTTITVYTKSGYFLYKPYIESATFQ